MSFNIDTTATNTTNTNNPTNKIEAPFDGLDLEGAVINDYGSAESVELADSTDSLEPSYLISTDPTGLFIVPSTGSDEEDANSTLPPGTILDCGGKVVCPVYPTPNEDLSDIADEGSGLVFKEALDGTLFRLFHAGGQWRIATAFSLDVTRVNYRFGHSKTFAEMFQEGLNNTPQVRLQDLDPGYIYLFILEHPENVIIIQHTEPRIVHVATLSVSNGTGYQNHPGIRIPGAGQKELTYPDLESMQKDLGIPSDSSPNVIPSPCDRVGIIISQQQADGTVRRWRQNDATYTAAKEFRGRFSDPRYRLLEIICSNKMSDEEKEGELQRFITVFPNYSETLKTLDRSLERLFLITTTFYVMYFIHRSHSLVQNPQTGEMEEKVSPNRELVEGHFVKFLHRMQREVYRAKLQPRRQRMTYDHIADFILIQDPPQVLHLLNGLKVIDTSYTPEEREVLMSYLD